jgi:hypothetical protein
VPPSPIAKRHGQRDPDTVGERATEDREVALARNPALFVA